MRVLLLSLVILSFTGCFRIVSDDTAKVAAQSNADLNASLDYIKEEAVERQDFPTAMAAETAKSHGENMAKAMKVEKEDLPSARVTKDEWKADPTKAYDESSVLVKEDGVSLQNVVGAGLAGLSVIAIALKLGQGLLKAHPVIGPILGAAGTLFGYADPVKDSVHNKIIDALEEYKDTDPKWEENPVFKLISSKLTRKEKDYIKDKLHGT